MSVPFGWSVGDIFVAIQFIAKVANALHESTGARHQYAEARSFLNMMQYTLKRIGRYVKKQDPAARNVELQALLDVVRMEYESFRVYLEKEYPSLASNQNWISQTWNMLWWTRDQMNSRVLQLKQAITDALVALNTTLLLDCIGSVNASKTLHENYVRQNTDLLVDIHKRVCLIEASASKDVPTMKSALNNMDQDIDRIRNAATHERDSLKNTNAAAQADTIPQTQANIDMITAMDRMLDAKLASFYDFLDTKSRDKLSPKEAQDIEELKKSIKASRVRLADIAEDSSSCLKAMSSALSTIRRLDGTGWSQWMTPVALHLSGYGSLIRDAQTLAQVTPKLLNNCDKYLEQSGVKNTVMQRFSAAPR